MLLSKRPPLAWRSLLLLSIVTTALFLADDYILRFLGAPDRAELELGYVTALWATNLCFWLSGRRWLVNICLVLFSIMQLLQLAKIDYSGTPLHPYDIANMVANQADVTAVLLHELPQRWHVILAWLLPYGSLFILFNRYMPAYRRPAHRYWSWIPVVLVVYAMISRPLSALDHRMIDFMPGITRSSLHNSMGTFGYYVARMAFRDTPTVKRPDFAPYSVTRTSVTDRPDNIILVIPDSLRFDRMGIGGYQRATTPHLAALEAKGELQVAEGVASSVATGASLPLLINGVREPGNLDALHNQTANLFRRAKEAGYHTVWVSSQESKLLSNLGARYIDKILTEEDYPAALEQNGDMAMLDVLRQLELGPKNLIVMMIRSVHAPYEAAYSSADDPAKYRRWPTEDVNDNRRMSNAYDNAIVYLDEVLDRTIEWTNSLPGDSLWMLTSDHAEELNKSGLWGHNVLTPRVARVPMALYQHHDGANDTRWRLPAGEYISHYQLTKWLLARMGFSLHNPNEKPHQMFQQGFNLFGDTPYRRIIKTPTGLVFCKRRFISSFRAAPGCPEGGAIHNFYADLDAHL